MPGGFELFGVQHLLALTCVGLCLWWLLAASRGPLATARTRFRMRIASVVLLLDMAWWQVEMLVEGSWTAAHSLPLHLCDASLLVTAAALWRPAPWPAALVWFWGAGGASLALLTPDLDRGFPDPGFLRFFLTHGGVLGAALFLAFRLRLPLPGSPLKVSSRSERAAGRRPPRADPLPAGRSSRATSPHELPCSAGGSRSRFGRVAWRVFLLTNAWALLAALGNLLSGGNYMYLRRPPSAGSLLDLLGPWPWYLLWGEAVCLLLFLLLERLHPVGTASSTPPEPPAPRRP